MSKGLSLLFHNTIGEIASRNYYKKMVKELIRKLIEKTPNGTGKAVAVGAYDSKTGWVIASFAGPIPEKIHPDLQKLADNIGGVGSLGLTNKNIVGVCAEFRAVNELLWKGNKLSDIKITAPIRPRTGATINYCANCLAMFANLIDN